MRCSCEAHDCCEQALSFWGVLEELDVGKKVPDLKGLGFSLLGSNDSLVFTWTVSDFEASATRTTATS